MCGRETALKSILQTDWGSPKDLFLNSTWSSPVVSGGCVDSSPSKFLE